MLLCKAFAVLRSPVRGSMAYHHTISWHRFISTIDISLWGARFLRAADREVGAMLLLFILCDSHSSTICCELAAVPLAPSVTLYTAMHYDACHRTRQLALMTKVLLGAYIRLSDEHPDVSARGYSILVAPPLSCDLAPNDAPDVIYSNNRFSSTPTPSLEASTTLSATSPHADD
ncbi:hypothetical protein L207DRAFT_607284 [Hyaloscypha variabilis F]|uniref:Uncharacterized protein n=1 Tax=Hyaloscypha variabilis (strain UAMH 11265 / GT02V1 / F) TaxID=1149755 RepID=A0A2J6SAJ5_HYAVF|nr:hypothetical protein L207DRAFT_607284 [Hyaloscypha variabilis F]